MSPSWRFDEATYAATAPSFDNPDFVEVVLHSYRHRFGGVAGDPSLDDIEARLAALPEIVAPCIVLDGRDDGVSPPATHDADRLQFTGRYERKLIEGAGHNLPQENPDAFASAVIALASSKHRTNSAPQQ